MNNKSQYLIIALAFLEIVFCAFLIPLLWFRLQDANLSKELENETVESATISFSDDTYLNYEAIPVEEKIDCANSYNSTFTAIYLEKGEKYSANQICSIAAGEWEDLLLFKEDSELLQRLKKMNVADPLRYYGQFLESQVEGAAEGEIGYADVETVDEVDVDLDEAFFYSDEETDVELRLEPEMYIDASEPEKAFVFWSISFYDVNDGSTLFILVDDETGKLLSLTGSIAQYKGKENYSLYADNKEIAELLKAFSEEKNENQAIQQ